MPANDELSARLLVLEDRLARYERDFDALENKIQRQADEHQQLANDWKMVRRGGSLVGWIIALAIAISTLIASVKGWLKL